MKISKATFEILQNFADIQDGLVVDEANCIKTSSLGGATVALFDTEETFPVFGIWDIKKFNQLINVFSIENCDFDFETSEDFVTISHLHDNKQVQYEFHDIAHFPEFEEMKPSDNYKKFSPDVGDGNFKFNISSDQIKELKRVNGIFAFSEDFLKITMVNGKGTITIFSNRKETKSDYQIDIEGEGSGEVTTKIEDMKIINDDYQALATEFIIKYQSTTKPLIYLIKNSELRGNR